MCFWSCKWQLTPISAGFLITDQQPFFCSQAAHCSFAVGTLVRPFHLESLWLLLFHRSWLPSNLSGRSLSLPLHLSLSSSCSCQFFLHTLPKNLICVLSFTVNYELWLYYQICAWSIYLFIFPELEFSISSFLLEFFILDAPLSPSLELTWRGLLFTFPLGISPGFSISGLFSQLYRVANIFSFSSCIEITTNQSSYLNDPLFKI